MSAPLTRRTFTVDEYHRMAEAGISLRYDRERKIPLYARAGIPEAWLVNLEGDTIELCREPSPEGYRDVRMAKRGGTLSPFRLPGVTLSVDEVLGPRP